MASPSPNLLGLPGELRKIIYRFATKQVNLTPVGNKDRGLTVIVERGPIPQMLAVNKQIRDEYMDAISSRMTLVFWLDALAPFQLDLQNVMRKDVPSTFLKSITWCKLSLTMTGYMIEDARANLGVPIPERSAGEFLRPMVQTILKTLETVVSPSAHIWMLFCTLDYHRLGSGGRIMPDGWNLHFHLLRTFKTDLLDQFLSDTARGWPRSDKLQFDLVMFTPLHCTLDSSDAMTANVVDVAPGHRKSHVLWNLIPTEATEGEQEQENHHGGFKPEMIKLVRFENARS